MTVQRHLVGACCLRDRLNTDAPDSVVVEQVTRGRENAIPGRNLLVFSLAYSFLRGHQRLSLDTGVTGQYLDRCYRSVTQHAADVTPVRFGTTASPEGNAHDC
jgi:hypothetical protein